MPLIVTRSPRTRQPQGVVPLNPALAALGLYADTLGRRVPGVAESVSARVPSAFGVGARMLAYGSHYAQTNLTTNPLRRTYVLSVLQLASSSSQFPRLLDRAGDNDLCYLNEAGGTLEFARSYSVARGVWAVPAPAMNTPFTIALSLDASSSSNAPLIAINGMLQTVTTAEAPSGTANTSGASPWYVGNRSALDREIDGVVANFVAIDDALPGPTLIALTRNPHQVYAPIERRVWVPSASSAVPSITAVYADSVTASSVVPRVTLDFA